MDVVAFRAIFETIATPQVVVDPAGIVVAASREYLRRITAEPESILGHSLFELPPYAKSESARHKLARAFDGTLQSAVPHVVELEEAIPCAFRRFTRGVLTPIAGAAGTVEHVVHAFEPQAPPSTLARSHRELRLRALIDESFGAIALLDLHGSFAFATPGIERLLGFEPGQLSGVPVLRVVHADDAARFAAELERLRDQPDGCSATTRLRCARQDGSWRTLEATLVNQLEDRELAAIVVTLRDVTEQAAQQEQQKLASLGVLAAGIAHDFNNLLMAVMGNAGLLEREFPPASPQQRCLQQIEEASLRASGLCSQLLAYAGKGQVQLSAVDLNLLVQRATHVLQLAIGKNASLRFDLSGGLPRVEADAEQLRQVLTSLVANASEAVSERGGVITIRTGSAYVDRSCPDQARLSGELQPGEYLYLEVADDGIGLSEEVKARMFEPFYTTKFLGRGLGLSAALGIMRGHRGAIQVRSELGAGASFRLLLPRPAARITAEPANDQGMPMAASDSRSGRGERLTG